MSTQEQSGTRPRRRWALAAVIALASVSPFLVPSGSSAAPPPSTVTDEILRWNFYTLDVLRRANPAMGPTGMSRGAAVAALAAYDAVNSITPIGQPYRRQYADGPRCAALTATQRQQCLDAAINHATAIALERKFPEAAAFIRASRDAEDARIGSGLAVDIGRAIGNQSASEMLNFTSNDGSDNNSAYTPGTEPGAWRPTGNGCTAAISANWGQVRPLALTSGAQFRPPRPGGFSGYAQLLASPLYAQQFNEVKSLGRFDSATRTAQQTQIAFFWANDVGGTYLPPGQLLEHTRIVAQQRGLTLQQNARLFGLVATALADAAITAWDSKFPTQIDLWRPETAIRLAGTDNNAATTADTAWAPLSVLPDGRRFSPCFPAYTSGHATFGGAWAAVMRLFFGTDNVTFVATTDDPNARGVTRTFASFSAAATENGRSRVFLGVHFQFDADFGLSSGNSVGQYVFSNFLRSA